MQTLFEPSFFYLFSRTYQKSGPSLKILVANLKTLWLSKHNETERQTDRQKRKERDAQDGLPKKAS
jgi:hypothetical protein